jgi:hypothetical protein
MAHGQDYGGKENGWQRLSQKRPAIGNKKMTVNKTTPPPAKPFFFIVSLFFHGPPY